MEKIEILNYLKTPASTVYEALTTEKGLGDVWTNKLKVFKPEAYKMGQNVNFTNFNYIINETKP